jgi:hypothetical protein
VTPPTTPRPCRRCLKPVQWARTERGKWLPLDPEPDPKGNQAAWQDADGVWKTRQVGPGAGPNDKPWDFERIYMPHVSTTTCKPEEAVVAPIKPLPENVVPISAARSIRGGKREPRRTQ